MTSDVGSSATTSGGTFFPASVSAVPTVPAPTTTAAQPVLTLAQRVDAVPGLGRAELRSADASAMSSTLLELWSAMTNRPAHELAAGDKHPDGTARISSQVAVWLIGRVSQAYGRRTLVNLSRVKNLESLRSLGGLTGLLRSVISADSEGTLV